MKRYKVIDGNEVRTGTAEEILNALLHREGGLASDLQGLNVDQYADLLIKNAKFYLAKDAAEVILSSQIPTMDKALSVLNSSIASDTHILMSEDIA